MDSDVGSKSPGCPATSERTAKGLRGQREAEWERSRLEGAGCSATGFDGMLRSRGSPPTGHSEVDSEVDRNRRAAWQREADDEGTVEVCDEPEGAVGVARAADWGGR